MLAARFVHSAFPSAARFEYAVTDIGRCGLVLPVYGAIGEALVIGSVPVADMGGSGVLPLAVGSLRVELEAGQVDADANVAGYRSAGIRRHVCTLASVDGPRSLGRLHAGARTSTRYAPRAG